MACNIYPDKLTLQNNYLTELQNKIPGIDITNPSTPQYQLTDALAVQNEQILDLFNNLYSKLYLDGSTGDLLDELGQLFFVARRQATKSIPTVKATVSATTLITIGDKFTYTLDLSQYTALETITLTVGGANEFSLEADVAGAVVIPEGGQFTKNILDPNVLTITSNAIYKGTDVETDDDYRARIKNSVSNLSTGPLKSIETQILQIDGLSRVRVDDIFTNDTIPMANIKILIEGAPPDSSSPENIALQNKIGLAIFEKKAPGVLTAGDVVFQFENPNTVGNFFSYSYSIPIENKLWVKTMVLPLDGVGYTFLDVDVFKEDFKNQFINELNKIGLGDTLFYSILIENMNEWLYTKGAFLSGSELIGLSLDSGVTYKKQDLKEAKNGYFGLDTDPLSWSVIIG